MIELPETYTLAKQIEETLIGKTIVNAVADSHHHSFAWYMGDPKLYGQLLNGKKSPALLLMVDDRKFGRRICGFPSTMGYALVIFVPMISDRTSTSFFWSLTMVLRLYAPCRCTAGWKPFRTAKTKAVII
jgi:hypothetical protein